MEKKESFDIVKKLEGYPYAYSCKLCKTVYGSEYKIDAGYCPSCSKKINNKTKSKKQIR